MADQLLQGSEANKKKIYPVNYIQNISDSDNNESLIDILKRFNSLTVDYNTDAPTTRLQIPEKFRKQGMILSYIDKGVLNSYVYTSIDVSDDEWKSDANWTTYRSGGLGNLDSVNATSITLDSVSPATAKATIIGDSINFQFGIPRGPKGDAGDIGATGPRGLQGPPGEVPIIPVFFNIFTRSDNVDTPPAVPKGGLYNPDSLQLLNIPSGWSLSADALIGYVYQSTGSFNSSTGVQIGAWSEPALISGKDGAAAAAGKDGNSIEFIYQLQKDVNNNLTAPNSNQQDGYVPDGWTDHPQGISITNKVEYVCSRLKKDNVWGAFSTPAIWSKWSVDGKDGDGVEYIFQRTATPDAPTVPTDVSQDNDYVPTGWTDNPSGVSQQNPYEWVCTRKQTNGVWGAFKGSSEDATKAALWATWQKGDAGDAGPMGDSAVTMYSYSSGPSVKPALVADNINPGSNWGAVWPTDYTVDKTVWSISGIKTYDNKLKGTWAGPYLLTGIPGVATTPNYKTYIYIKQDTKPDKPAAGIDATTIPTGWADYPSDTGNWWQCIGDVNGTSGKVTAWSEVLPVNGKDGQAQDGSHVEFRFCLGSATAPDKALVNNKRTPDGYTIAPPAVTTGKYLWMTTATITSSDALSGTWSAPVKISGEQGPKGDTGPAGSPGPAGSQGVAGVPGVDIELRYGLGEELYDPFIIDGLDQTDIDNQLAKRIPDEQYYTLNVPTPTTTTPYIWCIQARIQHQTNNDAGTVVGGKWSQPFRLSGTNGINGTSGKKGQILYPAGLYNLDTAYTTDDIKAPYVLDSKDGNFYVLNSIMTWKGSEQNNTYPSQNAAKTDGSAVWVKFDSFEAVYAKIGIIANGLIGSAVFNGDYMFSMIGVVTTKTSQVAGMDNVIILTKRSATAITAKPDMTGVPNKNDYAWAPTGWTNGVIPEGTDTLYVYTYYIDRPDDSVAPVAYTQDTLPLYHTQTINVYGSNYEDFDSAHIYDGHFCPNFLVNLKTGEGHYAAGKIKFNSDGTGNFGDAIYWDSEGNFIGELWDKPQSGTTVNLPMIPNGCSKLVRMPFNNSDTSNPQTFLLNAENSRATIVTYKSKSSPTPMTAKGSMQLTCPDKGMGILMCNGFINENGDEYWHVGFMYYTPIEVEAAEVTATIDYNVRGAADNRGTITLSQTTDLYANFSIKYQQAGAGYGAGSKIITVPPNTKTVNFDIGYRVISMEVSTPEGSASYSFKVVMGEIQYAAYIRLYCGVGITALSEGRAGYITHNLDRDVVSSAITINYTYKYFRTGGIELQSLQDSRIIDPNNKLITASGSCTIPANTNSVVVDDNLPVGADLVNTIITGAAANPALPNIYIDY